MSDIMAAQQTDVAPRTQPLNAFNNRVSLMGETAIPLVPSTHLGFDVDIVEFRDAHGSPTNAPEDGRVSCDNSAVNVSLSSDFRTVSVRVADPATLGRAVVSYTGNGGRLNLSVTVEMQPGGAVSAFFNLGNVRLVERPTTDPVPVPVPVPDPAPVDPPADGSGAPVIPTN